MNQLLRSCTGHLETQGFISTRQSRRDLSSECKHLVRPSNSGSPALPGDANQPSAAAEQLSDSGSDSSNSIFTPSDPSDNAVLDLVAPLVEGRMDGDGEGGRDTPPGGLEMALSAPLPEDRVDGGGQGGREAPPGREGDENPSSVGDDRRSNGEISLEEPPVETAGAGLGVGVAMGHDSAAGASAGGAELTPQEVLVKYRKRFEELKAVKQVN